MIAENLIKGKCKIKIIILTEKCQIIDYNSPTSGSMLTVLNVCCRSDSPRIALQRQHAALHSSQELHGNSQKMHSNSWEMHGNSKGSMLPFKAHLLYSGNIPAAGMLVLFSWVQHAAAGGSFPVVCCTPANLIISLINLPQLTIK